MKKIQALTCLALFAVAGPRLPAAPSEPAEKGADTVQARIEGEEASIGNGSLLLEIELAGRKVRTRSISNRITGEATPLEGDDFVLVLSGGKNLKSSGFLLEKAAEEPAESGGKRLAFHLIRDDLRVRYVVEIRPGEPWASRWLEISGGSGRLEKLSLSEWQCENAWGQSAPGKTVETLGAPQGMGQPAFVADLFLAVVHPGAENLARGKRIACRLAADDALGGKEPVRTRRCVVGAGEAGGAARAFLRFIDARRANPARMVFLVNDWYWKDKSRPLECLQAIAKVKAETGVPIDSFTLDDGWDRDWDEASGLWGRLGRARFPGGWEALQAAARPAGMSISLWYGPIGGYGGRDQRVEFGKKLGYETAGDRLCLAGPKYRKHAIESFSAWASRGMDYIKVDGFWPDCKAGDHGHPPSPGGAVAQMDALQEFFAALRRARPGLLIGYTSGSNPSPFWLEHCDFVWRGGADDSHAGAGDPIDRNATYIDGCLQLHRPTDMPVSAFVTFDIVQPRVESSSDAAFERGAWWLAARTSLHHDWYVQAGDLTPERWRILARAARWAKDHEKVFRFGRMVGGDPRQGEVYGFSAFDEGAGTLALRNPSAEPKAIERQLSNLLGLPLAARKKSYRLAGVFGETKALEGIRPGNSTVKAELPPLAVAVFEVRAEG